MSLQSFGYFLFLPVTALCYLHLSRRFQTPFLLAASVFFYWMNRPTAAGPLMQWLPLAVLALESVFLWRMALRLERSERKGRVLAIGIAVVLAVLILFKYYNALILPVSPMLPAVLQRLPFPLGISFYSFAAISYLVDVKRGDMPAAHRFVDLAAFLSFFGTITSGPICRAAQVLPQLEEEHRFDSDRTVNALRLFALGLFKKAALADALGMVVGQIYADIPGHGGPALLLALVLYTLQLYFDFGGYSEMARASALLLGITVPENFKTPFYATNFSGFWSRWHISLSGWLQDYLFTPLVWADVSRVPLLGRKVQRFSPVFCVFCVFFISGFWHGNTLPFVVWGLWQAICRAGEEIMHQKLGKPKKKAPIGRIRAKRVAVFCLWTFGMAFFSVGSKVGGTGSLSDAFALLRGIFRGWSPARFVSEVWQAVQTGFYANTLMAAAYLVFIVLGLALAFRLDWLRFNRFKSKPAEQMVASLPGARRWVLYYALVLFIFAGLIMQSGGFAGLNMGIYAGF